MAAPSLLRLVALALAAAAAAAQLPPLPTIPGFSLQYEDDFNGPTINGAVFNVADGYVHTQYDIVCYEASDAYTENGNLVLRTRFNPTQCSLAGAPPQTYQWTSGWVDTNGKLTVTNGRVDVRALLPPPTFRVWPSSFLISEKNNRDTGLCWPLATEIDLYEVAGGFAGAANTQLGLNNLCASYHWGNQCFIDLGAANDGCFNAQQLDYADAFHTYTAEWDDNSITWSVDDVPYFTIDRSSGATFPLDPMVLILETALAWWIEPQDITIAPPQFPTDNSNGYTFHYVDWIRIWSRD